MVEIRMNFDSPMIEFQCGRTKGKRRGKNMALSGIAVTAS
jgi:hypothetical protein